MTFYQLFDYSSTEWLDICEQINETKILKLSDVKQLISNLGKLADDVEFKTLDALDADFNENDLVKIFDNIKQYALKLPVLFPSNKIPRLNKSCQMVEFKRYEVLCLLSHMILCTLKKTKRNFYWVTFENWLTDGRCCAISYLKTLMEYFRQSFLIENHETDEYMNEFVVFKRHIGDLNHINSILDSQECKLSNLKLMLNGSIGDEPLPEVDFANCDIGFGITGTQEEMLFGASPELCVAMLFSDTLEADEAVSMTGARKIAFFKGYGLNVVVDSFVPKEHQNWKERTIIAIDALDYSDEFDSTFKKQISTNCLNRELVKAYAGFSSVTNTTISTGHWGCGAFCGNKQLKVLIQLVAASVSKNNLLFYCHGDLKFYESLKALLMLLENLNINTYALWKLVSNIQNENLEDENVFKYLENKLKFLQ